MTILIYQAACSENYALLSNTVLNITVFMLVRNIFLNDFVLLVSETEFQSDSVGLFR